MWAGRSADVRTAKDRRPRTAETESKTGSAACRGFKSRPVHQFS